VWFEKKQSDKEPQNEWGMGEANLGITVDNFHKEKTTIQEHIKKLCNVELTLLVKRRPLSSVKVGGQKKSRS